LLGRFAEHGDEDAFAALLQRHGPMVLRVCRRALHPAQDAEDGFPATLLLLARKAGSIPKRGPGAGGVFGGAGRPGHKGRGQEAGRKARERRAADQRRSGPGFEAAWRELQAVLDEALQALPEKYRAALVLCYLEGLTQEEAARRLGCPLGTVRSRL